MSDMKTMTLIYKFNLKPPFSLKEFLEDLEKEFIQAAIKENGGNCAKAADQLKMNRTTLVEKRRKYGMPMQKKGS